MGILYANTTPTPPTIPEVQVISKHEYIKLNWKNDSESSIDSLTGYSDFAGYRIYRSKDGGTTWGDSWDRIFDYSGNFVGWKPYAQFDLIAELDSLHCVYPNPLGDLHSTGYYGESGELCYSKGYKQNPDIEYSNKFFITPDSIVYEPGYIRGGCPFGQEHISHLASESHSGDCFNVGVASRFDPMASWIDLGVNDSLKSKFIDKNVLDGVEYTYAVTAYDIGMLSFNVDYLSTDPNNLVENYCNDVDYYCDGEECRGDGSTQEYINKISCEDAGYTWVSVV